MCKGWGNLEVAYIHINLASTNDKQPIITGALSAYWSAVHFHTEWSSDLSSLLISLAVVGLNAHVWSRHNWHVKGEWSMVICSRVVGLFISVHRSPFTFQLARTHPGLNRMSHCAGVMWPHWSWIQTTVSWLQQSCGFGPVAFETYQPDGPLVMTIVPATVCTYMTSKGLNWTRAILILIFRKFH